MEKKIFTLVVVNEEMEICGCSSYTTIEAARKELKADYNRLKETLKAEGWEDDDLGEDELTDDTYWVKYGESDYYAEIKESVLVGE